MKQSEIDAFYDKIVRGLPDDEIDYLASRAPANEKPQVQSETVITPNIITPVPGLKYPIAENLRQNLDESLKQREGLTRQIRSDIPDLSAKAEKSMASARKSFEDLSAPMPDYTPNAEIEKQLKVSREAANAPINTERDLLSEAILSFGPALGGMVLGENAQIGNTEIQSGARKLFESQRTEKIKYLQDARDKAAKRVEYLEKLKQSDRESFDKRQERELNKLKAIAESNLKFTELDSKQLNEAVKQYTDADQKFTDAYERGSLEYAKMAQTPEELAAKEKRAQIMSPAGVKATDTAYAKDEYVPFILGGGYATAMKGLSQIDDAITKLEKNPKLTGGPGRLLPNKVRALTDSEAMAVEEQVKQSIQDTLKATLGGQYTEREGQAVLDRAYNSALPASENIKKLRREKARLEEQLNAKLKAAKYFESQQSLGGYQGNVKGSASEMLKAQPKTTVTVSNGKETYEIDPSDLEAAKKDGFKEVNK